jgi:predicted nucleotidyltransferase component of viral defense system
MNLGASIRAKLKNIAHHNGVAFQVVATRYLHERFLYRLSVSAFAGQLFLKGGNLVYALQGFATRPTLDIDLLGIAIASNEKVISDTISEIAAIRCEDSVWFDTGSIKTIPIAERSIYNGMRCLVVCGFDTLRQTLQIDTGFGDVVTPRPVKLQYPVLLQQMPPPILFAYTPETVIAEKFQSMVELGSINSRMKDIYDIYQLLLSQQVDEKILADAIRSTFQNRNTPLNTSSAIFRMEYAFSKHNHRMWQAFLTKINADDRLSFDFVILHIIENLKRFML